jgi:SNF2 family DNA or RNA helicase
MTKMLDILEDFLLPLGYKYARYGSLINPAFFLLF